MTREAPEDALAIKPASWWLKLGAASLVLLLIVAVAGLEIRREQVREDLREPIAIPSLGAPPSPRPVFFVDSTAGAWDACAATIPSSWTNGVEGAAEHADAIVSCASRRESGASTRYLAFDWSGLLATHAVQLEEPRRCAALAFAILRFEQELTHRERREVRSYALGAPARVRDGAEALAACGGDDDFRAEARDALHALERDRPSLAPIVAWLVEDNRRRVYSWLARTAWDYDDPIFYDGDGLVDRYRLQLAEWSRWTRVRDLSSRAEVDVLGRHVDALSDEGVYLGVIQEELAQVRALRAARMLLDGSDEPDPRTGLPMTRVESCVVSDGARVLCALDPEAPPRERDPLQHLVTHINDPMSAW